MTAALELREGRLPGPGAGVNKRPGGPNWTIRGGDTFAELGRDADCDFQPGLYINPARGAFPITTARALIIAGGSTCRSNRSSSSTKRLSFTPPRFGGSPQRIRAVRPTSRGKCRSCSRK